MQKVIIHSGYWFDSANRNIEWRGRAGSRHMKLILLNSSKGMSIKCYQRDSVDISLWFAASHPLFHLRTARNIWIDPFECWLNFFFFPNFKFLIGKNRTGPRWASWNLGVFLCIRCAGIHRNLGVHISRVKSVNLDSWTPEQVVSLQQMGNSRARAVYEAQLPDGFRRPQTDSALESFIRAKYEHKKYVAREWVQQPAPKVNWDKEIDEEMEKQKRKKKGLGIASSTISSSSISDSRKSTISLKSTPIPAPLPKPTVRSQPQPLIPTNGSICLFHFRIILAARKRHPGRSLLPLLLPIHQLVTVIHSVPTCWACHRPQTLMI